MRLSLRRQCWPDGAGGGVSPSPWEVGLSGPETRPRAKPETRPKANPEARPKAKTFAGVWRYTNDLSWEASAQVAVGGGGGKKMWGGWGGRVKKRETNNRKRV